MERPQLIEPGVKSFLSHTLSNCRQIKEKYYNRIYNILGFILLVCVIGAWLYYRYKGKMSPEEREERSRRQKEYILSKLRLVNATHYAQSKGIPMDGRGVSILSNSGSGGGGGGSSGGGVSTGGLGMGMLTNLPRWVGPDEQYYQTR